MGNIHKLIEHAKAKGWDVGYKDINDPQIETDLNRDFLASEKTQAWLKRRIPAGRAGSPQEVARLVGALYTENIAFLTGETIYIDGGQGANH